MCATATVAADHLNARAQAEFAKLFASLECRGWMVDPHTGSEDGGPRPSTPHRAAAVKTYEQAGRGKPLSRAVINARHSAAGASVAARRRVFGDARTLYGKGGGVFGLAKLSHLLMEAWMADATLNANRMVVRWHESQQKAGFKFLVTQMMGYLTGGPQRYTGRPMDAAHAHLGISPAEWRTFMQIAARVLDDAGVSDGVRRKLLEIVGGFERECVLARGREPPADPGPSRPPDSTRGTSYHRLGGVYPIAHFADVLVERLVAPHSPVDIGAEPIDAPGARRHKPGLKYLLTELLCHATGGPEVVTASGFDDAKLGVPSAAWTSFVTIASEACAVLPSPYHRAMMLSTLNEKFEELCVGALKDGPGAAASPALAARAKIEAAGFERFDAVAAMAQAHGDGERALELLVRGWRPDETALEDARKAAADEQPKCPFGHDDPARRATAAAAPPPTAAAAPWWASEPEPKGWFRSFASAFDSEAAYASEAAAGAAVQPMAIPLIDGALPMATGAKALAEKGIAVEQIALMLRVDADAVRATLFGDALAAAEAGGGDARGKHIGHPMQLRLDELLEEDVTLCCPISLVLFVNPVRAPDGFTYERAAAEELARDGDGRFVSPMTGDEVAATFEPAADAKRRAHAFRVARCGELLAFVAEVAAEFPNMAVEAVARVTEHLATLPPADVVTMSPAVHEACDALLAVARGADNPDGPWHAKPAELRRVKGLKLQATTGAGADMRMLTCLVCFDDIPALNGVECAGAPPPPRPPPGGREIWARLLYGEAGEAGGAAGGADQDAEKHFVCNECLEGHVLGSISPDVMDLFTQRGGVRCVNPGCEAPCFADVTLAKVLPEDVFKQYQVAKDRVAEQRINAELEAGFEQRLARQREGGAAQLVKEHIVDNILTMRCPRCKQAFIDYNGCMALTCSRAGCGCGFCALCQEDCGGDAHPHIARGCPYAERLDVKKGEFFLSEEKFNVAASKFKAIKLQEYLATLTDARREDALRLCDRELRDLNIDPRTGRYQGWMPKPGRWWG